jgi:hypothetical protein
MEKNNYIIEIEVLVCKTKYSIHIVFYVSIPKGDIGSVFGYERNW